MMVMWYHARCIFNTFIRARTSTRIIESPDDIEGFENLEPEDQAMIRRIIDGSEDLRSARGGRRSDTGGNKATPKKRAGAPDDPDGPPSATKRRQLEHEEATLLRKGDRVWTYCRVRPTAPDRPAGPAGPPAAAGMVVAIKSAKPELGVIVEEVQDKHVIVQFESAEQEKQRLEAYVDRRRQRIKAWFRYPRIFDGKKQRLPISWIQYKRPPPRLCGCTKQQWNHECHCDRITGGSGISCSRGSSKKVWGVAQ